MVQAIDLVRASISLVTIETDISLDVYHLSNAVLSSSSIVSSKAAATTSISSSQSTKGSIIATHTGPPMISQGNVNFSYYDCLGEPSPNRALSNLVDDSNAMTVEKCLGECWSYKYAGIEWASELVPSISHYSRAFC